MMDTFGVPALPSEQEASLAREALRVLGAGAAEGEALRVQVTAPDRAPATLELPAAAAHLLKVILTELAAGRGVSVVPVDSEITIAQAADLLNVSPPFVVGMIEKGALPARTFGGNIRLLPLKDVLAYKAERRQRARDAMREIAAIDQELGLL